MLRVLPRINEDINEEWISDKTRYAVDGLARQRLDRPVHPRGRQAAPRHLGRGAGRRRRQAEGHRARPHRRHRRRPAGRGVDEGRARPVPRRWACSPPTAARTAWRWAPGPRQSWLFNSTIAGIEEADVVLLVGVNPRLEAPVLNARLRKRWLAGALQVGVIGEQADLTYPLRIPGRRARRRLGGLAKAKSDFVKALKAAKAPAIIVGRGRSDPRRRRGGAEGGRRGVAKAFGMTWNVLHSAAARVGGLDLGFMPGEGGKTAAELAAKGGADVLFLLGADEIDTSASSAFTVYLGTHGDRGAHPPT